MENQEFQRVAEDFKFATIDEKIKIYLSAEGLTQPQYKELLRMFPMNELYRLEAAMM